MVKSPEQMRLIFRNSAIGSRRGLELAIASANYELAALNIRQLFKSLVMQGLIAWRCDLESPIIYFQEATAGIREGLKIMRDLDCSRNPHICIPCERAAFLSYLLNEAPIQCDTVDLTSDRLLDAVLTQRLLAEWNDTLWSRGMEQLQAVRGSTLAIETYRSYRSILDARQRDLALIEKAATLFAKRRTDGFYRGGEQTEGGGNDNAITLDYRLSAVLMCVGYQGNLGHLWKWG